MKIASLFALLIITSMRADELSFGHLPLKTKMSPDAQALQLYSSKAIEGALDSLKKSPPYYRHHVNVYREGEIYVTRYQNRKYPRILSWIIRDFKKAGFNDAYIIPALPSKAIQPTKNPPLSSHFDIQSHQVPLTQHDQTRLIIDASKAYQQHDYTQATIYYEMMIASGMKDRQILINLAYLYGREGSFSLLEKKIEGKRGINDYLYAYGVGTLEAGRSDLYNTLSAHLIYDKSGKLAMLCGYFFEKENDPKRASTFYKMAYDTAPNDPHILYAYARNADIMGDKEKALYLYAQLSQLDSNFESLRIASQSRIQTLRNSQ